MSAGEILIVDDEPGNLDLLIGILEEHDYQIRIATSGRRALSAVAAQRPDLIMLDISMPEMDGYEVCSRLKTDRAFSPIPVIFISVHDDVLDKVRAFESGGVDYIIKPFHPEEVLARVESQLKISRLQRELERQNAELEQKAAEVVQASRAKSTFLANMSHELRTPLNGILGFVQLLQRDDALTPEQREKVAIIMRSGEHLLGLLNDVLSISKIESGQIALNEQTFDLQRLLLGLEEMFRLKAQANGLHLLVEVEADLPRYAFGDEGKLRQILINLLGNAVKFTEVGGVALRVRWNDGRAHFEVEDTGDGIDADEIGKLFQPFVQTESGRRGHEGTGLGLAISRQFVELMGGTIAMQSEPGKGTTLRFDVKLREVLEAELPERRVVVGLEQGQPDYRILVVDDKFENRTVVSGLLQAIGLHVREASSGREAITIWSQWHPHLIWMDMHMPEMDGYDATREIRAREAHDEEVARGAGNPADRPPTVVLGLSASVFESDRRQILAAGCDDFVGKPFREETIFEKMAEHLGMRFVYGASPEDRPAATPVALTHERLARLDRGWVDGFRRALTEGDVAAANAAVEAICDDSELAVELRSMIRSYRFDEMLQLVESR